MDESLAERVAALERAITDGDHDLSALAREGELADRVEALEAEVSELTDRVDELDAATQALRGYVGNVEAVNREVERQAEAALAAVESIEHHTEKIPAGAQSSGATDVREPDESRRRATQEQRPTAGTERKENDGRGPEVPSGRTRTCPTCGESVSTPPSDPGERSSFTQPPNKNKSSPRDTVSAPQDSGGERFSTPPVSADTGEDIESKFNSESESDGTDPIERIKNLL